MKIKKGYSLKEQNNSFSVCFNDIPLKKPIMLSKTGAFLWGILSDSDLNTSQLLEKVLKEFEISTVLALGEIDNFLKLVKEHNIID